MAGPYIKTSCVVDMTGFNRGFEMAMQYTKRTPSEAVNFAAKEVAFGAYKYTPVTGAARVDSDLSVIVAPVIGKRGKPLQMFSKKGKSIAKNQINSSTLAVMIIQARSNPNSKYNLMTGGRYALPNSPFKTGKGGLMAGRAAMALMVDMMVKARHRSANGFIRAGWLPDMHLYSSLCPAKYGGARRPPTMTNPELGGGTPAKAGTSNAVATIENNVGGEGKNALSHNQGMLRVGTPALQYALDDEGRVAMNYALSKTGREELEIPVNKAWA